MRKTIGLLLLSCALCLLAACRAEDAPPGAFPDEAAITAALERAGLPGEISGEETVAAAEGYTTFAVRDPSETYGDSDDPVLVASVTGGIYGGERILSLTFDQSVASEQIDWADWRERLVFAAALSGECADEEEVYRAFLGNAVPAGRDRCQWDAQLSNSYCVITWAHRSSRTYDAAQFEVREHRAVMWVTVYASREQYEAHMAEHRKATGS